tara:strand:- start:957 stop:1307 length:351 start_codon:yes stop_codon:yes gene_type:complete
MKKVILFLVFSVVVSGSLFAQKNADKKLQRHTDAYITRVESKITLSKEEKEKLIVLKNEHTKSSFQITSEHKGTPELKVNRKENNKKFSLALKEAFGKERAQEIKKASKRKKKKKK